MIKNNKLIWPILGVVILIVAVFLYLRYASQSQQQTQLANSIQSAQTTEAGLNAAQAVSANQAAQLQSQLTQAELQLDGIRASFPISVDGIKYNALLFSLANSHSLTILDITTSGPDTQVEGNATYQVTNFSLHVETNASKLVTTTSNGHKQYIDNAVNNIIGFAREVSFSDNFTTVTARVTTIAIPKPLSDAEIDLMTRSVKRQLLQETVGLLSPQQLADLMQTTGVPSLDVGELTETEITAVLQAALQVTPNLIVRGEPASQAIHDRLADTMTQSGQIPASIEISVYGLLR